MYWVCVGIQPQTQISIPYETTTATLELSPYVSWTPTPTLTPTDPPGFTPTPTPGALPANCRAYYQAKTGDTCQAVLSTYTFVSEAQFLSWHPSLNGNCAGLLPGYWYCAAAFDWADLPMPPTVTTPPTPAQTDTAADCAAWYFATGDDCAFIASIFGTFSLRSSSRGTRRCRATARGSSRTRTTAWPFRGPPRNGRRRWPRPRDVRRSPAWRIGFLLLFYPSGLFT